jgi:hypothetical protein
MVVNFVSYKLCKLFGVSFQMFFVCINHFPQFTVFRNLHNFYSVHSKV